MRLQVLGCSGGIGGSRADAQPEPDPPSAIRAAGLRSARASQMRTSSFLLDDDILIDAGTGVEDLSVPQLARIDHVFLSHSHLDHICALPLMIDSVGGSRAKPLVVHALQETIDALKAHIFNWVIWPDFTEIPHYERPWMRFEPLTALVAANAGLADLDHIVTTSRKHLLFGGWLLVEHGWTQGEAVRALFTQSSYSAVETCRDYGGNERLTLGQWL